MGESLEVRRARVLARLNTRGVTSAQAIRELVRIITGREGEVAEYFSDYAFSVTVRLLSQDSSVLLRELIRQIDEIKPAHLLFHTTGAIQPAVLRNWNRLYFTNLTFGLRISNLGEGITYLNGARTLDGTWKLSPVIVKGLKLNRFSWAMRAAAPQKTRVALSFWARAPNSRKIAAGAAYRVTERNRQRLRAGFSCTVSARNAQSFEVAVTTRRQHTLNSAFLLDGTKKLNAGTERSVL